MSQSHEVERMLLFSLLFLHTVPAVQVEAVVEVVKVELLVKNPYNYDYNYTLRLW